ncbi:MAG: iron ABC transporter substrate-binding protein [Actinomycetota bacterium]
MALTTRSARRGAVLLLLLLVAPILTSCSSDEGRLVIYSGRTRNLIDPLLQQFSEETGIAIDVVYDDSANLALAIDEEGRNTPADVFLSQSPGALGFLDEKGRLAALPQGVLSLVPAELEAGDETWIGLSGRVRTLVYNTDLVDPADLPASVLDLTAPELAGRVAVAPTNGSFQDFVTAMRIELGDDAAAEWLAGMADNDSPTYPNNLAIVQAVGRGEVPMGLVNHYYLHRELAEDPDLPAANHFFPSGDLGSLLIVTAAAVIDGSDMSDEAAQFIEYMLSADAQRFFADETFEYPLAAGVKPSGGVPPFTEISTTSIDLDKLGGGLERTTQLIEQSGLSRG